MRACGPGPGEGGVEDAGAENKLTSENLAEGFRLFKTAFDFFSDMDPSVIRALRLKQMVEEGWVPYRIIFREMKKQKSQTRLQCISVKLPQACLPLLPALQPPPPVPPLRPQGQPLCLPVLSLLSREMVRRMKAFPLIRFHVAALLRAVPRLPGPAAAWRRPICGLWCRTGQDPGRWLGSRAPTLKEKAAGTEAEKFQIIYRFDAIRTFGYLSRLKVAQTALTLLALPPGFYWYSHGLMTLSSLYFAGGIAGFALAMLCWMSHFFRRLVGILYVNEAGTVLRVAHLTFWGRRQDTDWPVADVVPMTETSDRPQELFMRIQQYSGKQTFYLTLRYGRVLDRERFTRVFGTLDTPK
ncbi:transmembrane protein 186 isoform X1 [Canis lupus familiaris]|uniref:Transmembrane protein 186 n=1 Tax=Canis lupus familiaris TaxID=9615 RepID=A0A8P0PGF3_CANLF|nr:transmembrane protein 186 isoform X1 [Canis lupus dingo]XP_038396352.1 transmembrane protein 186 isoform X1 [Canis lupus familiaris]XP_038403518.1 transmembrane protein 186 isoform X1 [Canis lupus familiaris]